MSLQPQSFSPLFGKAPDSAPPVAENAERRENAAQPSVASVASADLLLPHNIGGIFDLAFDLYRAHFRVFSVQAAVLLLPTQAVLALLFNCWVKPLDSFTDAHPDDAAATFNLLCGGLFTGIPQYGIPGLLSLLALAIASAPVAITLTDIYRGRAPSWTDSFRRAFLRIPRIIVGWGVVGLALAAVVTITSLLGVLALFLVALAFQDHVPPAFYGILSAGLVLAPYLLGMMIVAFYFVFATPLILLEDVPIASIPARCWQLVGRPRALKTWTALVFLPIVFFTVQALILVSLSSLLSLVSLPSLLQFLLESSLTVLLITFLQPYLLIFLNVLYFDYRIQRDGLDVRLLAENLAPLVLPAPYAGLTFPPVTGAFPPASPFPVNAAYAPAAPAVPFPPATTPRAPAWPQPTAGGLQPPPAAPAVNVPLISENAPVPHMDFSFPPPSASQPSSSQPSSSQPASSQPASSQPASSQQEDNP